MTLEQTVDWSSPDAQLVLNRIHTQAAWSARRLAPLAVLLVLVLVEVVVWHSAYFLISAGIVAVFTLVVTRRLNAMLRRAAAASGVATYRLDDALHIQNALGTFHIPLGEISRLRSYPAGVIVQYAGLSTLTLPDGPVSRALAERLGARSRGKAG